jgi:preprotein translocase subunit SecA
MEGRKWQNGLHQAIEAKERLPVTARTVDAARITVQSFFRRYEHVCGMTGTAQAVRRELRKTYDLRVMTIPTHRPCRRQSFRHRIFRTREAKIRAVIAEVGAIRRDGRAVLIGTRSVERSEQLAVAFQAAGIPCEVLNARHHRREAQIVARAGRSGVVTIATNMAGRGTDIKLADEVRVAGGLHVIATEMHSASRIDRQLVGRAARQGDPGSFRFFLSLEDDLLQLLPEKLRTKLKDRIDAGGEAELDDTWLTIFRAAQRSAEALDARHRKSLLTREAELAKTYRQLGLDPYLEAFDDL